MCLEFGRRCRRSGPAPVRLGKLTYCLHPHHVYHCLYGPFFSPPAMGYVRSGATQCAYEQFRSSSSIRTGPDGIRVASGGTRVTLGWHSGGTYVRTWPGWHAGGIRVALGRHSGDTRVALGGTYVAGVARGWQPGGTRTALGWHSGGTRVAVGKAEAPSSCNVRFLFRAGLDQPRRSCAVRLDGRTRSDGDLVHTQPVANVRIRTYVRKQGCDRLRPVSWFVQFKLHTKVSFVQSLRTYPMWCSARCSAKPGRRTERGQFVVHRSSSDPDSSGRWLPQVTARPERATGSVNSSEQAFPRDWNRCSAEAASLRPKLDFFSLEFCFAAAFCFVWKGISALRRPPPG